MRLPINIGVVGKFALALILLGAALIAFVSLYMGNTLAEQRQAILLSDMQNNAELRMDSLDRFINERLIDIATISAKGSILSNEQASMEEKLVYLHEFERFSKTYASISIYDKNGMRIADTRGLGAGLNQSNREFVKEALAGKVYYSPKPEMSVTLHVPVLYFSAPLYGKDGELIGAVATRVLSTRLGETMRLSEDDRVEIVDKNDLVIFSSYDKPEELVNKSDLLLLANINIFKAGELSTSSFEMEDNKMQLHILAKEPGFQNYRGNGWVSIDEIDTELALRQVNELRSQMLVFGTLMIGVIVVIMLYVVNALFISPLNEFVKVGAELEQGNYSARVKVKSEDEIGLLSKSFNRAIERIEKMDIEHKQVEKAKTEFMSITGHELRSPMTPMKAQLQMLKGGYFGKVPKKQKESLDIVLRNTERLDKIIVDMLEISRIQAARLKFEFKRVDLSDYIKKMPAELASFLPEKKVKIELKLEKLPIIEVDPDRTVQVLRNLLTNALKFSNPGGKVVVSAFDDGDYLRFSVEDFGRGIDEESQKRLFEPFFQAQSAMSREYGGTGLGLAISRGIVEAQNGKIWFESRLGQGTKFFFTVPKKPVLDIKPINLLLTHRGDVTEKLKKAFIAYLGPMGEKEFAALKDKQMLDYTHIHEYLKELEEAGVISNEQENALEFEVLKTLSPKKERR